MTTTAKRGRPAKKVVEAPQEAPVKAAPKEPKFSVKQNINPNRILEYRLVRGGGAVFMMHQKGVTIYDKKEDKVREIRYCPSEPSIYKDEQAESAVRKSVVFVDKILLVRPDQPNLRDYMAAHPDNKANGGNLFYLVDNEKKAEVDVDKEFVLADAISLVRTKSFDDLLAVAAAYGVNVDRQASEIKHDLIVIAKKSPSNFIKAFDNPEVLMKAKIRMASKYGIIELSKSAVRWKDSASLIVSVPAGKEPLDVMLRFCLTEAGAATVEELDRQLR
jgi:hypothetical protein